MAIYSKYDKFGFDKDGFNKAGFNKMGYNREGYDRQGYDRRGFNKAGFNKLTGRDLEGYDADGYDESGFDRNGYDKHGYDTAGYDADGFDRDGFNSNGFNTDGYDREGFDFDGFDANGFDRQGFNRRGYDIEGFDRDGFSNDGYNRDGLDRDGYDMNGYKNGYDRNGYDRDGFDIDGFNPDGFDREGYNRDGYNVDGLDRNGRDIYGFDCEGYDQNGFDVQGWNASGVNILGYDKFGFNRDNLSIDGFNRDQFDSDGYNLLTGFNLQGYDREGYNINDIDADGYDREGYDTQGRNRAGYDRNGYDLNGYDKNGYNARGYNKNGFDRDGYDSSGYDRTGYNREGYNFNGYDKRGYDIYGYNKDGKYDPKRIQPDDSVRAENVDLRFEQEYLAKCIKEVQRIKDNEFIARKKKQYPSKTLVYRDYDTREIVKKVEVCPDIEQLIGILNRNYAERLSQPYVARISYRETSKLYLGKRSIDGWVVDWADPRAKYYYQYQMYIGNNETKLSLVRDFDILHGQLRSYKDLYNIETLSGTSEEAKLHASEVSDERLRRIIESNRESKQIHDIIASIQQNQYNIIAEDKDKNIIVNGCAGSGKSMILMHRIRFIQYNNTVHLKDFVVLSPTKALSQESRQLSEILQISDVQQYSIAEFYSNCIDAYFQRRGFLHESISVSEDTVTDEILLYTNDYLDSLKCKLRNISESAYPDKLTYLSEEESKLNAHIKEKCALLNVKSTDFPAIIKNYQEIKEDVTQYSVKALLQFKEILEKQLSHMQTLQITYEFFSALLDLQILTEGGINIYYGVESMDKEMPQTHKFLLHLDIDGWLNAIHKEKDKVTSVKDCILSMQLYLDNPLDMNGFRAIANELLKLSVETTQAYCKHLESSIAELNFTATKVEALEEFLSKNIIVKEISKNVPEDSFDTLADFYGTYAGPLVENNIDIFDFFDSCILLQRRLDALATDKQSKSGNSYLFYKTLYVLGIPDDSRNIKVSQAFAMLYLLSVRLSGPIEKENKYLYIDEFQDMAPIEIKLLMQMFPNSHFALFGDPKQCINQKGIRDIKNLPPNRWSLFSITENYRNAREITEYVNHRAGMSMRPVGLKGIQRTFTEYPHFNVSKDDRVAVIVKNETDALEGILAAYGADNVNVFSTTLKMRRGIYNVIPIQLAKGLEFEKVIVVSNGMNMSEMYVACTRAIAELYVMDELSPSEPSISPCSEGNTPPTAFQIENTDANPIPVTLRNDAFAITVSGALEGLFYVLPHSFGRKYYTKKKLTNMVLVTQLAGEKQQIHVAVDTDSKLIYIPWKMYTENKRFFTATSRFLIYRTI